MFRVVAPVMIVAAAPAAAQQPPLTKQAVASLVDETNRLLRENYLYPEKVEDIVKRLSGSLASGRYDLTDPTMLAERMTQDLQAVTSDKHMSVKYNPEQARADLAVRSNPSAAAPGPNQYALQTMANTNYGIPELKVLPGNVRYMNISPSFLWDPVNSPKALDAAMWFLKGGDAYIIDLRSTLGGSPTTVRYIISHFMDPDQKLMTYYFKGESSESRTETVPNGRLTAPLFVLTSPNSASASEEFASHIKHFKLGTLVGARTPGAGNRNSVFGTPGGFVVSISMGTAIHPVTNKGWEGDGIVPDIAVAPPAALDAAHLEALKRVKEKASGAKLAQIEWAMVELAAKANPPTLGAQELAGYVGGYGADHKVTEQGGRLYWHQGAQQWEILPYGQDLFGMRDRPNVRLRFVRGGGAITAVEELSMMGRRQTFPRTGS